MTGKHIVRAMTPEQVARAMEMAKAGKSWTQIAHRYNKRPQLVKSCVERAKAEGLNAWGMRQREDA